MNTLLFPQWSLTITCQSLHLECSKDSTISIPLTSASTPFPTLNQEPLTTSTHWDGFIFTEPIWPPWAPTCSSMFPGLWSCGWHIGQSQTSGTVTPSVGWNMRSNRELYHSHLRGQNVLMVVNGVLCSVAIKVSVSKISSGVQKGFWMFHVVVSFLWLPFFCSLLQQAEPHGNNLTMTIEPQWCTKMCMACVQELWWFVWLPVPFALCKQDKGNNMFGCNQSFTLSNQSRIFHNSKLCNVLFHCVHSVRTTCFVSGRYLSWTRRCPILHQNQVQWTLQKRLTGPVQLSSRR